MTRKEPLPPDTESGLGELTELMATAISNAEARAEVERLAEEQAALRRVATLVAQGVPSAELFSAVSKEVARVFSAVEPSLLATVIRFDPGPEGVLVGASRPYEREPIGSHWAPKELYVSAHVLRTARSARVDEADLEAVGGPDADMLRLRGFLYQVGSPVVVEGRLWGAMTLNSTEALPRDTEERLEKFTELVATAIANAESQEARAVLTEEQAALRRVATLVASGGGPEPVFHAVAGEVQRLFDSSASVIVRFEDDGTATTLGTHSGLAAPGTRHAVDPDFVMGSVRRTRRAVRFETDDPTAVSMPDVVRESGMRSTVAAPIVVEGELWGAIGVGSSVGSLPPGTEARLATFTELVATAIANAESQSALEQLVDEQAALRRVATLVARGITPEEVFQAVAAEIGVLFGSDVGAIVRFEDDRTVTVLGDVGGPHEGGKRVTLDPGYAVDVVRETSRSARFDTDDPSAADMPSLVRALGIRSAVASPILVQGELWGAITIASLDGPMPLGAERRLTEFTELVATAVANTQAREEVTLLADEQAALRRVATLVASDAASTEVFETVATEVGKLLDTDITVVGRYDGDGSATAIGSWSASPGGVPVGTRSAIGGHNVLTIVAETGKPARVDGYDNASGEAGEIARRYGWRSSIAAPIVVEDRLWGVMLVATRRPEPFPAGAEERLAAFTDLVSTAVANAQAHDEVRRFGDEQATLRRIATFVAKGVQPREVFAAVTEEVAATFRAITAVLKFEDDPPGVVLAGASKEIDVPIGTLWPIDDAFAAEEVYRTGRSARVGREQWSSAGGPIGEAVNRLGIVSTVASPIIVEGTRWGVITVNGREELPRDTEQRLEKFTELVTTAISNAASRVAIRRLADEQAALRRVAVLVAQQPSPSEVFTAVTEAVGLLLDADLAVLHVFPRDGTATTIASWSADGPILPIGTRFPLDGDNLAARIFETRAPARLHSYDEAWERAETDLVRSLRMRSAVGAPILVEGKLWGALMAATRGVEPWAENAETRIAAFTELVATAIANAEARAEVERLADEQAALRRVATLVARGTPPEDIFAAAVNEVAGLLPVASATMGRFEPNDTVTTVASWSTSEAAFPTGRRWPTKGKNVAWIVLQTRRSGRIDDFSDATDPIGVAAREAGYKSAVGSPIVVEGDLWGVMTASSSEGPLPPGTEARLASFTELVATAIANAEGKSALNASRRRIVSASDETRRRIERDLHDGTQQRLVSLGLAVRAAEATVPPDRTDLQADLSQIAAGLAGAVEDLQELTRGIHPAILSRGGLVPALRTLARRSSIPVALDLPTGVPVPEPIEVAAYFVASEALANATKHAEASHIEISLAQIEGRLVLAIRDDGVGGADPARGSGLVGLTDRVEALGGSLDIQSRPGNGTQITVRLPLELESVNPEEPI